MCERHNNKLSHVWASSVSHCVDSFVALSQDSSITGIYHWSGDENMTKYDMAVAMAEACGISKEHLKPDTSDSGGTTRPYDAHLEPNKLDKLGICHRRPFKDAIKECLEPLREKEYR